MNRTALTIFSICALVAVAFWWSASPSRLAWVSNAALADKVKDLKNMPAPVALPPGKEHLKVATVAGGCFWCVEFAFEKVPEGVYDVVSGYSGGPEENPTYYDVAGGKTGHTEAVQSYYDPKVITYEGLLQVLFRTADPTDKDGQYYDRGQQYRPGIYYHDEEQKAVALKFREMIDKSGRYPKPVVIEIEPYKNFYKAEELHQDYARKNPLHYLMYTYGSGRIAYQEEIWGADLKLDFDKLRPGGTSAPAPAAGPETADKATSASKASAKPM